MSLAETKNRIDWIDMAKGYGMLAVIIAHICTGPLHAWIYTFHMPLFFFCQAMSSAIKINLIYL